MKGFWNNAHWLALIIVLAWLGAGALPPGPTGTPDLSETAAFPVVVNGRTKPLDTVARTSLMLLHGKQTLRLEGGRRLSALEWLWLVMARPEAADTLPVFLIHDPDILGLMEMPRAEGKLFTFGQIRPHLDALREQARKANDIPAQRRSRFQRHVLTLFENLTLYHQLKNTLQEEGTEDMPARIEAYHAALGPGIQAVLAMQKGEEHDEAALAPLQEFVESFSFLERTGSFFAIPPSLDQGGVPEWSRMGGALLDAIRSQQINPAAQSYATMLFASRTENAEAFGKAASAYTEWLARHRPEDVRLAGLEEFFNRYAPFYRAMVLYVVIFILACASWLTKPRELALTAFALLVAALALHTLGLVARMAIEGRPPVTNLYSSAIFVGWGAVVIATVLERLFRNGIGAATAGAIGFTTLVIAHHLSLGGDTMEMMRAVLDSNFWLATHVVVITMGYSATFLAGFLAILYIVRKVFTRTMDEPTARSLETMVYGIVCFATLFSMVGTILGGIWADQSWGRFWGWDPKENGALLIVFWNAIILHARWGGMIRRRGLMAMAVFGNVVTSWSWFGTNMLGVGLHSYGFIDAAFMWLSAFVVSQLVLIALAFRVNTRASGP